MFTVFVETQREEETLEHATKDQVDTLSELALNALKTVQQTQTARPQAENVGQKRGSVKRRKQLLVQNTRGGFLPLLAALAPISLSLITKLFKSGRNSSIRIDSIQPKVACWSPSKYSCLKPLFCLSTPLLVLIVVNSRSFLNAYIHFCKEKRKLASDNGNSSKMFCKCTLCCGSHVFVM